MTYASLFPAYLIVSTLFCALLGINGWSLHCRQQAAERREQLRERGLLP